MCQNRIGQEIRTNPSFQNPRFFGNPNVQGQIISQARGGFFDPVALNAAGAMGVPAPAAPAPTQAPAPASSGSNTATGLPNLASLMQRAGVPSTIPVPSINTQPRGGG